MNLNDKLLNDFNSLSADNQLKVIKFVEELKLKETSSLNNLMDETIEDNLEALKQLAK